MAERTWIADGNDEGRSYVIRIDRDNRTVGWVSGKLGTVLDLLSDQAYADAIGEESDTIDVFVLTDLCGPVPVSIVKERCPDIGFIAVDARWRDPLVRGKAGQRYERGFYKIVEA